MAEDLVTLGFSFTSNNAETEITKLITAFDDLEKKSTDAKKELVKLFDTSFRPELEKATKALGRFNSGLIQTANFAGQAVSAIKPLGTQMAKISGERVKPVSAAAIDSLRTYSERANEAADAVSKLKITPSKLNPAPVSRLGSEFNTTARSADNLTESMRRMFVSSAVAIYFRQATAAAVNFGQELVYIQTLERNFNLDRIRSGILDMSSIYGSSAELAKSYYIAVSSGIRDSEESTLGFTKTAAKAAALIRSDVPTAVDAMTSAMNAYGMSARDAGRAGDVLFKIVDYGKANGQQLANSFGQITATAVTAGLSIEELGASIASITKVIPTRNAITFLNNALSKMIRPTKESRQAAKDLGVEFGLSAIKAKGFGNVMQEVFAAGQKNQEALLRLFPDLRGQRAMLQLLGKGWGDYQNAMKEFANSAGAMDKAFQVLDNDLYVQLNKVPNTLNKIKIAAGDLLIGIFTLNGMLTPVIKAFNEMGESGQKVLGSLVLLVGGISALKAVQFVWHTMQATEIRNNAILSAQRQKEIIERNAVAAAAMAEAAAKTGGTVTGVAGNSTAVLKQNVAVNAASAQMAAKVANANLARAKSELLTAQNVMRSTYMTKLDTAAKVGGLSASRWNLATAADLNAAEAANAAFKKAAIDVSVKKTAAINAETAALAAQTAALKANAGASAFSNLNTIGGVTKTGVGFAGGFKAMFDTKSFTASMKTSGTAFKQFFSILKGGTSAVVAGTVAFSGLKIMLTGLGAVLGKVAAAITGIFTAANVIIAGAVLAIGGLIDVLSSKGSSWGEKIGNSRVVSKVGAGIYEFFTGAISEAEKLSERLDQKIKWASEKEKYRKWAKELSSQFGNIAEAASPVNFQAAQKKIEVNLSEVKNAIDKGIFSAPAQLIKQLNEQKNQLGAYNFTAALAEAEKRYGVKLNYSQESDFNAQNMRTIGLLTKQGDKSDEAYFNAFKEVMDSRKNFAVRQEQISETIKDLNEKLENAKISANQKADELLAPYQEVARFYSAQRDALSGLREMIDKVKFDRLSPEAQMQSYMSSMNSSLDALWNMQGSASHSAEAMQKYMKSAIDSYESALKYANSQINKMQSLQNTIAGDYYDAQISATTGYANKIILMRKRANDLFAESDILFPDDLEKSYSKAKQAMSLEIQAMQEEINQKNKLAQAEKSANENTLKLIQSMDKFSATSMTAIDANSLQALELQSRQFSALPSYNPSTQAQTGLGSSQAELSALYENQMKILEEYQKKAEERQVQEENRRAGIETRMNESFENIASTMQTAENELKNLAEKMADAAKLIAERLNGEEPSEDQSGSKKIVSKLQEIKNAIPSVVTY